jgi:hypothetical protein
MTKEFTDALGVDFDDAVRHHSVRFPVYRLRGLPARRLHEAKARLALIVEPVREVPHAMLVLDVHVKSMRTS